MNIQEKVIYLTGGTGFVGRAVTQAWLDLGVGHSVVVQSRHPERQSHPNSCVRFVQSYAEVDGPIYGIVNLAGAPIADARWSAARRKVLEDSRVRLTEDLCVRVSASEFKPRVVVSASAIGVYPRGEAQIDEEAPGGDGYAAQLCQRWEQAAMSFEPMSRLVLLRFGVVLGDGGMMAKLRVPFLLGLGGPVASGRQWFSWIHRQDAAALVIESLCQSEWSGVYNACAPEPVPQARFAKCFGKALSRPAFVPTPGFILKAIFGQMATELLIEGQRVLPVRALAAGFTFRFPRLEDAVNDACVNG